MVDAPGLIHLIVFCVVNKNKKINKHNIFFINQNYTGYYTSDNELSGIEKYATHNTFTTLTWVF
jgi:hypothetical protein